MYTMYQLFIKKKQICDDGRHGGPTNALDFKSGSQGLSFGQSSGSVFSDRALFSCSISLHSVV